MLPVYLDVHHRHASGASSAVSPSGRLGALLTNSRRNPALRRMLQAVLLLGIMLPLWLFLGPSWGSEAATSEPALLLHPPQGMQAACARLPAGISAEKGALWSTQQSRGGRKMAAGALPLPGAHLQHLILVRGPCAVVL
jgi:hypothetical protein